MTTDMFGQYKSQETKALQNINSSKYPDTNIDLERNIQRLNSFVDYISQYLQIMQKGVDQANQDMLQRTRDMLQNMGVLLAGGAIFDNDYGDLQYFLPVIGALLGFDKDTPFPLNLFQAAETFFLGYIVPLDSFGEIIQAMINDWGDRFNLNEEFLLSLNELLDAWQATGASFTELLNNIRDMFEMMGIGPNGLGPFADIWNALSRLLGGFDLGVIGDITDPILGAMAPWLQQLAKGIDKLNQIIKAWSKGVDDISGIINFASIFNGINWTAPNFTPAAALREWMENAMVPTGIFAGSDALASVADIADQARQNADEALANFALVLQRFGFTDVADWINDLLVTRGAANTAEANAATAAAKAALAEDLAKVGILRAKFGSNLVYSPNFEDSTIGRVAYTSLSPAAYVYSTEQKHSGTQSLKITYDAAAVAAGAQGMQMRVVPSEAFLPTQPQAWFWVEAWVYLPAAHSNAGNVQLFIDARDSKGVNATQWPVAYSQPVTNISRDQWVKLQGHVQVPAGLDQIILVVYRGSGTLNDVWYVDDVVMREVTEAKLANELATAAQSLANTAKANADQAIANFTAILTKFGFVQISDWINDIYNTKGVANTANSTATTANTNANTALANFQTALTKFGFGTVSAWVDDLFNTKGTATTANTNATNAQGTANTANTNANTALTNFTTVLTKFGLPTVADWANDLWGTKGVANTANSTATTANTNANTAITNSNTANTKATTVQSWFTARNRDFQNLAVGSDFDAAVIPWGTLVSGLTDMDTTVFRSGTKSLRLSTPVNPQTITHLTYLDSTGAAAYFEGKPNEQFYLEMWVRRSADWVGDNNGPRFRFSYGNGPSIGATMPNGNCVITAAMLPQADTWTKLTFTASMPNDPLINSFVLNISCQPPTGAGTLWIDDIVVRRIPLADAVPALPQSKITSLVTDLLGLTNTSNTANTNANTAIANASTAQGTANTASTNANQALSNFTTVLNKFGLATVALWADDLFTTKGTATTAGANANTAITNAGNAQTTANSANTTANTAKTNADQALANFTTVLNKFGLGTVALWADDLFGTKGTASTANTNANTAITNAATAQTTANTANTTANTANTTAGTANTNATTALNNFTTVLTKFGLGTVALWADDLFATKGTASTAGTNASTALTNASTAQTTANTAVTVGNAALSSGSNLCANPSWENLLPVFGNYTTLSTEQAYSGTKSLKIISNGVANYYSYVVSDNSGLVKVPCKPGDVFAVSMRVFGKATNVQTTGGTNGLTISADVFNAAGTGIGAQNVFATASTALNGVWTEVTGTITIPANGVSASFYVQVRSNLVTSGDAYYFDDIKVYRITEAANADTKAVAAQGTANTASTNATTALSNFTTVLSKFGLGTVALWADDLFATKGTASTAGTNASTALTNAATAQSTATSAQTTANTANTTANTASTNASQALSNFTTVLTKFGLGTVALWADDLFATKGTASTAGTNASTAITNAATADARAVVAKNVALGAASGDNVCTNGGAEADLYVSSMTLSTEQKRTGTRSFKLTSNGSSNTNAFGLLASDTASIYLPCNPGDVFSVEGYVRGHTSNVGNSGSLYLTVLGRDSTATAIWWGSVSRAASTSLNGVWTKMSGTVTAPANVVDYTVYIATGNPALPATEVYYFDDIVVRRITEGYNADTKAVAAQGTANTASTNATTALNNFQTALTKFGAATVSAWVDDLFTTKGTANTANTTANTANTAAGNAQTTANTASTNANTSLSNFTTLLNKFGIGTVALWADDLFATKGTASTASANASTAITNASSAQTTANTANSTANTASTNANQALTNFTTVLNKFGLATVALWADDIFNTKGTASTASTNASTAIANAATAQTAATNADGKAVVAQNLAKALIAGGSNIVSNPGFEDTTFYLGAGSYSTEQKRNGTYSVKLTCNGSTYQLPNLNTSTTGTVAIPVAGGEVFYCEAWVYGHASNVDTSYGVWMQMNFVNADGSSGNATVGTINAGTALNGKWTKVSGNLTLPSTAVRINAIWVVCQNLIPANNIYYWDDAIVREITTANTALTNAATAQGTANTASTNATTALGNFTTMLNKFGLGTVSLLADDLFATKGTANTANTTANSASTAAGNAQATANTANTTAGTANTNANQALANFTTVLNKFGLATVALWADDIFNTKGTASTASSNASTAISNAATADAKAVTADGKAVTADGKAVAAQGTANTASTNATTALGNFTTMLNKFSLGTVSALADDLFTTKGTASTANSTANTANSTANTANSTANTASTNANTSLGNFTTLLNKFGIATVSLWGDDLVATKSTASTANSTANTAKTNAATADAKAVTADGKAVTAQSAATTADGKAVTAQNTANTANTNANTGIANAAVADTKVSTLKLNIANSFTEDNLTDAGQEEARAAMVQLYAAVQANTNKINELIANNNNPTGTKGVTYNVNFGDFASLTAAGFTTTYSGPGTATVGISNGVAQWMNTTNVDRDAKIIYNQPTLTDFQFVRGTMSGAPQQGTGVSSPPKFHALLRVSNDGNSYIFGRAYCDGILSYKGELGCVVNGVETVWLTNIPLSWSLDMTIAAGVGTNARQYQVYSGGKLVVTHTEVGTASQLGPNNRRWGSISQLRAGSGLNAPFHAGKLAGCNMSDNETPVIIGSAARMFRAGTTEATFAGGNTETALPASFFSNIPYESRDIDANTADGTFTVTTEGLYQVECRLNMSTAVTAISEMRLQVSTGGGAFVTAQAGTSIYTNNAGCAMTGSWIQYLKAGDKIRIATVRGGINVNTWAGDAAGAQTYFAIAAIR